MTYARRVIALVCALSILPWLVVTALSATATATDGSLFTPVSGFALGKGADVRVRPKDFRAYRVDLAAVQTQLRGSGHLQLAIPDPAGTLTTFNLREDSVMEPEMQAEHPEIRTYSGADSDGSSIRLDVTPMGFHAFVRRPDGVTWLVDPATNNRGEDTVLSYAGGSAPATQTFVERELRGAVDSVAGGTSAPGFSVPGGIVSSRTYRMAFVTDPTYATYFGTANVFAEKTTMINRVNEVYNDDLAITFLLINGTDTKLNLDTAAKATGLNGPCGANACYTASQLSSCTGALIGRNSFVLGQIMGAENFDIGHIGLGNTGGGIAGLGVVGGTSKAQGCTGLTTPDGDLYAIDYVAHEVGHQMGGNHTFNGANGACAGGNRNGGTSVEPGSGSSIMAYAGICSADDLQPHSDPYFSERSVDEINTTTAATPTNLTERQSVAFLGLDPGEQIVLTCASCGSQTVAWSGTPATDAAALTTAVNAVTGATATLTGYDGAATVTATGFTASWSGSTDIKTLVVSPNAGSTFTAISGTINNGGPRTNQGTVAASSNSSPTVTAPADKTIPTRTPFTLTGSAADTNGGDTLTYMWEQNDVGGPSGQALQTNGKTVGPLFRQFGTAAIVSSSDTVMYHSPGENLAGTSPSRTFPDMAQILANNTNAATGSCSGPAGQALVDCYSEYLPTSAYAGASSSHALNFRLTARDEFTADVGADHPGGLSSDNLVLTVDTTAGPFLVTSRGTAGTASGIESVTWDVANTAGAALAPNVKITLSTDGGLTFPTVLSASTPNDGTESVTLPNVTTSTARIKVEAVGNYFFDVNDANFSIVPSSGNQAPVVDAGPDAGVALGGTFTSSGSFNDESSGTCTATVDYGDGSGVQALSLSGSTFTLNHTYTTTGAKTVTVVVTDSAALAGSDTATVTVNANAAPTVNTGPDASVVAGSTFTSSGSFTDESPNTATATVDYGDGSGVQPLTLSGSTFALSHTYTTAATRTVTVTVTDNAAQSGNDTATVTVTPAPPPTTHLGDGKGKFLSVKGSSTAHPSATGKAKFRFTADTTGATPSGSATFKFKKGKVAFAGTTVTAASTSGKTLTMTVSGTANGKSGYTLVIVAKDGSPDKIRVRLLKGTKVVYDSMPGKPSSKKPKTKLISGAITVG